MQEQQLLRPHVPRTGDPALVQQCGDDGERPRRDDPRGRAGQPPGGTQPSMRRPARSTVANRGCRTSHAVIRRPAVVESSRAARRAMLSPSATRSQNDGVRRPAGDHLDAVAERVDRGIHRATPPIRPTHPARARHAHVGRGPGTAEASTAVHLEGGSTALTVDRGTLGVLTANHVTVTPIKGAGASGRTFTFRIVDGKVDATTPAGDIDHNGGLQFAAGGKKLEVKDFVVNAGTAALTAEVRGTDTRIPLLKLDLGRAHIARGTTQIVVGNVGASLTGTAAAALNTTFGVHLFKEGLRIGAATVTARI